MYYPIQIPYTLGKRFAESVRYAEEVVPRFQDFVICIWEMQPLSEREATVDHVILADGCIDLVVHFGERQIGFGGMSKTMFEDKLYLPRRYFGARLKPGAFHAATGIPATEAMDFFLPLSAIDKNFDERRFFDLPFGEAKAFFKEYVGALIAGKERGAFVPLFDKFSDNIPASASEIYRVVGYSPKQCQRLFYRHFGLSPQMALCVIRFQKCLEILTGRKAGSGDAMDSLNFHDRSHFIRDFKKNIGITPLELVRKYAR